MKTKYHAELNGNAIENRPTRELVNQFSQSEWRPFESVCRARAELERRTGESWGVLDGLLSHEIEARENEKNRLEKEAALDRIESEMKASKTGFIRESKWTW